MTETETTPKMLRSFGLMMASVIVVLFGLLLPWIFESGYPTWPWIVAALFAAFGLVYPKALGPVYKIWMKFGHVMGWINTHIILGFVFYLIFAPLGLVMRLFGKDFLKRRYQPNEQSYRVSRSEEIKPEDMEKPF